MLSVAGHACSQRSIVSGKCCWNVEYITLPIAGYCDPIPENSHAIFLFVDV